MTKQHELTEQEFWTLIDALQTVAEAYKSAAVDVALALPDTPTAKHLHTQAMEAWKLAEILTDAEAITVHVQELDA